ncbi:MAG TPA: hypothetical protein VGN07_19865 [Steroidobacteraceae bacterium]|jgi:hypothetical protein
MNRRLFQRCVLWLLPLLVLRAFVPAGFMVSTAANGLELTFCSAQVPMLADQMPADHMMPADHAMHGAAHAGHAMPMADGNAVDPHAAHHAGKHFDSPCPFGVAVAAIVTDLLPVSLATVVAAVASVEFSSAPVFSAGPIRTDRIRGPPLFS